MPDLPLNPPPKPDDPAPGGGTPRRKAPSWVLLVILAAIFLVVFFSHGDKRSEIPYGFFRRQLQAGNVAKAELQGAKLLGEFKDPPLDMSGRKDAAGNPPHLETKFVTILSPLVDHDL